MTLEQSSNVLWQHFVALIEKKRFPQALLLVGPRHVPSFQLALRLTAKMLCQESDGPCQTCKICQLISQETHPDIQLIRAETKGSPIKIDQIRVLQEHIYQTPQQGHHRFIIIEPADKMNMAAANALLKILEEPPHHTFFMLLAEQIHSLPATILSRCQKTIFPVHDTWETFLSGKVYIEDSARGKLIRQLPVIVNDLVALYEGRESVCAVASRLAAHTLEDVLWLFYLLLTYMLEQQWINTPQNLSALQPLNKLAGHFPAEIIFNQFDKINALSKKINHNININAQLAIEDCLIQLLPAKD